MTQMLKYIALSALSGAAWGLLGYFILGEGKSGPPLWSTVQLSPPIGAFAALLTVAARDAGRWRRFTSSLFSLYVSVGLFAFLIALTNGGLNTPERFWESGLLLIGGLTFSGLFLVLGPLAWLNHELLWRVLPSRLEPE